MCAWKPNVTVAAVIERAGQFLLVEEHTTHGIGYNQPAGHLEEHESLIDAVIRETLEETAYHFIPRAVLGLYHWTPPAKPDMSYLRIAFIGDVKEPREARALDTGIIRAEWFDLNTIRALAPQHRSPQVLSCIDDYLAGQRFPLSLLHYLNGAHRA
jgi:8-oxo-dGTP pyrophosphatase MutT (NUDIX family)